MARPTMARRQSTIGVIVDSEFRVSMVPFQKQGKVWKSYMEFFIALCSIIIIREAMNEDILIVINHHDDHQLGRSMERSSSGDRLGGGRAAKAAVRRGSVTEEARSGARSARW